MSAALLALVAVCVAVLVSMAPLLRPEPAPQPLEDVTELQAKRADVVRALRDVELDFAMGKITEDDRDRMRAELEGRAVRILATLDARTEASREPGA